MFQRVLIWRRMTLMQQFEVNFFAWIIDSSSNSSETLLNWRILQEKTPWGLLLLIGGGFAIAEAAEESCLSYWLSQKLAAVESLPSSAIILIMTIMTTLITNVISNTATVTIVTPVLAQLVWNLFIQLSYVLLWIPIRSQRLCFQCGFRLFRLFIYAGDPRKTRPAWYFKKTHCGWTSEWCVDIH